MGLTRRGFIVGGSAGAAAAGAAASGLLATGAARAADGAAATPQELERLTRPMLLHVRDAASGQVGVLVDEEELVFTDKALVARLARAVH